MQKKITYTNRKNRTYKNGTRNVQVPTLTLIGALLESIGLSIGDSVTIKQENNSIIITKA